MSIALHFNLAVNVADAVSVQANFGQGMVIGEHSITGNRQDGPYSSLAELDADGFTLAAAPEIRGSAASFFAQRPRSSSILVGRRGVAEALPTALDAIEAVAPAAWYCSIMPSNTTNDILAMAAWHETRSKIAVVQSSSAALLDNTASAAQVSTLTIGGTATDGTYSIGAVDTWTGALIGTAPVVRAGGTPSSNADLATAMRAAWDLVPALAAISAPAAGAGDDVEITFDGLGNGYTFVLIAPGPGTITESTPAFAQNPGQLGAALGYDRTALVYHDSDAEYLAAAWIARCLGFNLDAPSGAGVWAYHRFKGITPTPLTTARKVNLLAYPANYYSPVTFTSGVQDPGVIFKGQMLSGRYIDITTTTDVTKARLEEALFAVPARAASTSRPKIPMTDDGAQLFASAGLGVLYNLARAGHYARDVVSDSTGRITPYVDVSVLPSAMTSAQRSTRSIQLNGEAAFAGAILTSGGQNTVGFTLDVSF